MCLSLLFIETTLDGIAPLFHPVKLPFSRRGYQSISCMFLKGYVESSLQDMIVCFLLLYSSMSKLSYNFADKYDKDE